MSAIFLVDDDEDDRVVFTSALNSLQIPVQCFTANDGKEALNLLQQELMIFPDLIFLDLNMPKLNGFGFLKAIKLIPGLRTIPVIIYTTSFNTRDIEESFRLGAFGYISKPTQYEDLRDILRNILEDSAHPFPGEKVIFKKPVTIL